MIKTLENRFYYLDNFRTVVESIRARYRHLLSADEQRFVDGFGDLPQASQALLVRMVMRKGELFRLSKLNYDEIGCTREKMHAAMALCDAGWLDAEPMIDIEQLFGLLTKAEIVEAFPLLRQNKGARKSQQLAMLLQAADDIANVPNIARARPLAAWHPGIDDRLLQLRIARLCERMRLMFFGNLHQDWSEFVLSELGIFNYERVDLSPLSQGFSTRREVDAYLHLHACRERFHNGETVQTVVADIPAAPYPNDWLERRRSKLLFQIAQHYERSGMLADALRLYADCPWPGARLRAVRVLERCGQPAAAFELAQLAEQQPEGEAETQQLLRIMPRLRRQLGYKKIAATSAPQIDQHLLLLPRPEQALPVEALLEAHLSRADAPAVYVENALLNSLFGLLFWDAIFAPLPGAFFHPFQSGPADLYSPDFRQRRAHHFDSGFAQLDCGEYQQTILRNFAAKANIQSPFVFWGAIDHTLLSMALTCLPPPHLRKCFERILQDIRNNRCGLPDLIQFWPAEKRYRMIEVKGPGDRLQDNQIRWLHYFAEQQMPVTVCYVQWAQEAA